MRGVTLHVERGETVGVVGESGAGKTLTALAALGLVPEPGRIASGSIRFEGVELRGASEAQYRPIRGGRIGLVLQEPGSALNPVSTIGAQIREAVRAHRAVSVREARARSRELLVRLGMPDPDLRLRQYPHQLSGGQRQRALLAVALAAEPDLLIADEPTAALDATLRAQVLDLLDSLRRERGLTILLITHDLSLVAEACDRVVVVYAGEVVEEGPVDELLAAPRHPYTQALLASLPRLGSGRATWPLPTIPGQAPSLRALPTGCAFHPRCALRRPECERRHPDWVALGDRRGARCLLVQATTAVS